MPVLASVCSLIYGLDFLNQAVDIAHSQFQQYTKQTGEETTLCFRDIYEALLTIKVSNFRQVGYHDAAKTAFSLILGKRNLFKCRRGLSFEWLFNENTVINARSLTNEMQCKVLVNFMLFWLYQRARNLPETKEIKHVIIIDDATRFIGTTNQLGGQKRTSPLGHILAVLRSAGICVIFATQLPAQIDPAVSSLSRNMIVVGNINGEENLRVIQSFISITQEQKSSILRFQTREMLAFISGSAWPYPVHGWAPFVEDMPAQNISSEDYSNMIDPWHSLTKIPQKETEQVPAPETIKSEQPTVNSSVDKLVWDCLNYPNDKVTEHIKRLDFSVRAYETAKNAAIQEGYLLHSMSGKSVYLIATPKAYEKFNLPCPYERSTSIEHSFYVNLAVHLLKQYTDLKVQPETPIGIKGATLDIATIDKSGKMTAYEITLSTTNLLSNAAKLQDTAYEKIVWLCKDAATANAVKSYFNKSSALPEDLTKKFDYLHFSKFSSQIKKGK
ncbi:MAG TPA: ATP-binding protein [Phycisphaerales bacterium]|nr:ATP-binding protein [Phycisphaerales bacterium]